MPDAAPARVEVDPHPRARVALALLRGVIKVTGFPAAVCAVLGLIAPPMLLLAACLGALTLLSFMAAFVIVFFFYARYSLAIMLALVAILNGLILCVISNNGLLVIGGIFGIGLYLSLLCIRIVGFYPEIENPPNGELTFLIGAVKRVRFSVPAILLLLIWFGASCRLLSETLTAQWFWLGVVCAAGLAGFLMAAVVRANAGKT